MSKKLTFGFYAISVVLLIFAGRIWYGANNISAEERQFLVLNEPFAYEELRESDGFRSYGSAVVRKPYQPVAIFTMPANPCIDCLNEVHAYLELFKQGGLHGESVHTDIVVVGDDLAATRRFAKIIDFDQEVLYISGQAYSDLLQSFGTTTVTHQILLVDPDKGRLFFRARLALGAESAPGVRENILWEARKAHEALSR
ncbi:MAG: hypothetical protein OXF48_01690 [Bacteroidetes bacterium]|nr:hypothetical protein [Bacteroidota bacterium]